MKTVDLQFGKSLMQLTQPLTYSCAFLIKTECILSQQFGLGILIFLIALQILQTRPPASDSSALKNEKLLLSIPLFIIKRYKNNGGFPQYLRQRRNTAQEFLIFFPQKIPL